MEIPGKPGQIPKKSSNIFIKAQLKTDEPIICSPNGKDILVPYQGRMDIHAIADGKYKGMLEATQTKSYSYYRKEFSAAGKYFLAFRKMDNFTPDDQVDIFDTATRKYLYHKVMPYSQSMQCSPCDSYLVFRSDDTHIDFIHAQSGIEHHKETTAGRMKHGPKQADIAFSSDETTCAFLDGQHVNANLIEFQIKILALAQKKIIGTIPGKKAFFKPKENILLVHDSQGISVYTVDNEKIAVLQKIPLGQKECIEFNTDGSLFKIDNTQFSAIENGWRIRSRECIISDFNSGIPVYEDHIPFETVRSENSPIFAYSPTFRKIIQGRNKRYMAVLADEAAQMQYLPPFSVDHATKCTFSPDDSHLLIQEGRKLLLNSTRVTTTGKKEMYTCTQLWTCFWPAQFSPDGKFLIYYSDNNYAKIMSLITP